MHIAARPQSCPVLTLPRKPGPVLPVCSSTALLDAIQRMSTVLDFMVILIRQTVINFAGAAHTNLEGYVRHSIVCTSTELVSCSKVEAHTASLLEYQQ